MERAIADVMRTTVRWDLSSRAGVLVRERETEHSQRQRRKDGHGKMGTVFDGATLSQGVLRATRNWKRLEGS